MENIFKQSFEFAQIKLFKNYSTLKNKQEFLQFDFEDAEKDLNLGNPFLEDNGLGKYTKKFVASASAANELYTIRLYEKENKRKFFYTDIPKDKLIRNDHQLPHIKIELVNAKRGFYNPQRGEHDWFETRKDKQIKRHYMNPFATIHLYKYERWIKKEEDKITIKFFWMDKSRNVNCKYFIKTTESTTLTFNLKTGNFSVIGYNRIRKTHKKSFYTNSFFSLEQALHKIYSPGIKYAGMNEIREEYLRIFDNEMFQYALKQTFNFDNICTYGDHKKMTPDFLSRWMPKFAEIKKIKLPNDGTRILTHFYPTEKFLKKNNRKLIASALDRFGAKSKVTIKLLHKYPYLNLIGLVRLCHIFGKDFSKYIGSINPEYFERTTHIEDMYSKNVILHDINDMYHKKYDPLDIEKENIVKVINDYTLNHLPLVSKNHNLTDLIIDHFKMLKDARMFYPEIRANARTYDTFHEEHTFLSRVQREINRGFSINCVFEKYIINEIEHPIEIITKGILYTNIEDPKYIGESKEVFYPKLLTTSEEYFEEGSYMSHCVGGYVEKYDSIIVSLRFGKERVTTEFNVKTRQPMQSRYFCNQAPPPHFVEALDRLCKRIKSIPVSIAPLDRQKVPLIINGTPVPLKELKEDVFAL